MAKGNAVKRIKGYGTGPANMRKTTTKIVRDEVGKLRQVTTVGFSGISGYRLHPTKGWKKERSFKPI